MASFYRARSEGRVSINADAIRKRWGEGWDDGVDWTAPESRKAAMAAWRASLGREVRSHDPEAFVMMVRALAGSMALVAPT